MAEFFISEQDYFGAQRIRVMVIEGLVGLLGLSNRDDTLRFAGSLMVCTAVGNVTDAQLLSRTKGLHGRLMRSVHRRVMPSHIPSSEDVLHVHAHSILLSEGIFREITVLDIPRLVPIHPLKHMLKECVLGGHCMGVLSAAVH